MVISISPDIYDKCVVFAKNRVDSSSELYKFRGESRVSKQLEDIVVGTLGEWAVKEYVEFLGLGECSDPDMIIYDKFNKSFDADLFCKDFNIHVKSQSVDSW